MFLFNWINLLEVWQFLKSGLKTLYYVLPVQAPEDQIFNYHDNFYIFSSYLHLHFLILATPENVIPWPNFPSHEKQFAYTSPAGYINKIYKENHSVKSFLFCRLYLMPWVLILLVGEFVLWFIQGKTFRKKWQLLFGQVRQQTTQWLTDNRGAWYKVIQAKFRLF